MGNGQFTKELWKNPDFRAHMIEVHKGQKAWNKGLTAEKDNRIPRYWLGKKRPLEIEKMRKANTGRKRIFSEEHKENLRKVVKRGEDNSLWKGRTKKVCPICGTVFEVRPSRENRVHCGHRCAMLGPRNPNWKNGITSLLTRIRKSFKYRQWRSDIFTRDDFTCQECGRRGCYLEAHHTPLDFTDIMELNDIKTYEQAMDCEELWNINNGITLCEGCHNETKLGRPKVNIGG